MWSYGLDLRSIRLAVVKVVVSQKKLVITVCLLKCLIFFNCSNEIFDFHASNS